MSGNGETTDPVLDVLKDIKVELQELRAEVRSGFDRVDARFDNVLTGPLGEAVREHDRRIRALESKQDD